MLYKILGLVLILPAIFFILGLLEYSASQCRSEQILKIFAKFLPNYEQISGITLVVIVFILYIFGFYLLTK